MCLIGADGHVALDALHGEVLPDALELLARVVIVLLLDVFVLHLQQ